MENHMQCKCHRVQYTQCACGHLYCSLTWKVCPRCLERLAAIDLRAAVAKLGAQS